VTPLPPTDFNAAPPPANRATLAYAMNLVGNRGSRTKTVAGTDPLGAAVAPTVSTYAYDSQDRATAVGGTSPTWDKKDNALTTGNGKTYQWDRRNRLTTSTTDGTTTTLGYDAEGLRVSKQVGASTPTRYLVDTMNPTGYGQVLVEYTGDGASRQPARTYTYGLDLISQRTILGGLVEFFSSDVLGTTRFLTRFDPTPGATGGLNGELGELTTQTFNYDAFGTLVGSTTATAYLYTGEQWDADVGAYYLRARWYLPEWGRFLSRDTYEGEEDDPISQNHFLYSHANPVSNTDPSGHSIDANAISVLTTANQSQNLQSRNAQVTSKAGRSGLRKASCVATYYSAKGVVTGIRLSANLRRSKGHHPRQKSHGGDEAQYLAEIARELHSLFHSLVAKIGLRDPALKGLNVFSGSADYWEDQVMRNPKLLGSLRSAHIRAASVIDRYCRYRGPHSFAVLTRQAWDFPAADVRKKFNPAGNYGD
jgi:RHS repeat-associated protein